MIEISCNLINKREYGAHLRYSFKYISSTIVLFANIVYIIQSSNQIPLYSDEGL